jgi:hypothetical protein
MFLKRLLSSPSQIEHAIVRDTWGDIIFQNLVDINLFFEFEYYHYRGYGKENGIVYHYFDYHPP